MKSILRLITGLIITLIAIPTANAIYCNPLIPTLNTYKSIYCDLGWSGNEKRDIELYKIVAEQLGYQELGHEFIQAVLESGPCTDITNYINENGITSDKLPIDILDLKISCEEESLTNSINTWSNVRGKVKTAYEKAKVIFQTKKKLEYNIKASEKFWDGQVVELERASFDLIVDLNLIEQVMFGSQAEWVDDIYSFPTDEDDEDTKSTPAADTETDTDTESDTETDTEIDTDDGVTGEETTTPGSEPECVPADDPNADLGNNPGATPSPNCGNSILDVLFGEQCDDGNNNSGDGCNQYCMLEDSGAGLGSSGDMCIDNEAVTFQNPSDSGGNSGNDSGSSDDESKETENICPPGTFPKKEISITGPEAPDSNGVPQSENYPGPFIGGTFKEYPPSNRPNCPEGYSELDIKTANIVDKTEKGDLEYVGESESVFEKPVCIPTEFCVSPDVIRDFLATSFFAVPGGNWRLLPAKNPIRQKLEAIEAVFCVELIKHTRPETPYRPDEGCIDCHIRAIVDSLNKALDTNVTPMINTTSSFGISSRWGPNMSFNLTTAIKQKLKLALPDPRTIEEKVDEAINKTKSETDIPEPATSISETPTERAERELRELEEKREALIEVMKNYRDTNNSLSDQAMFTRVKPLLIHMLQSFQVMQANYDQITREGAVESLANKKTCK